MREEMGPENIYILGMTVEEVEKLKSDGYDPVKFYEGNAELKKVIDMIEERLAESLRLSDLSTFAAMSPFHFSRVFKKETGVSPARYLQERRTRRALDLIQNSGFDLAEIAYMTGFSSQSHMGRWVKQLTGQTPAAIRISGAI